MSSTQSQLVLSWCLKAFVKLHNEAGSMSWSDGGIDVVLRWMLMDVDSTQYQQVIRSLLLTDVGTTQHQQVLCVVQCCDVLQNTRRLWSPTGSGGSRIFQRGSGGP